MHLKCKLCSLSMSASDDYGAASSVKLFVSFMIPHCVPAGYAAAAASTRPGVTVNRSLFHFLTCVYVFMYICVFLGWVGVC